MKRSLYLKMGEDYLCMCGACSDTTRDNYPAYRKEQKESMFEKLLKGVDIKLIEAYL